MSKNKGYENMRDLDSLSKEELEDLNDRAFRDLIMGFTLMNAADIFFHRSHRIVEKKKGIVRHNKKLVATRQAKLIMDAINAFDMEASSVDDMFYQGDKEAGVDPKDNMYDKIRRNANKYANLAQLYYDRCQDDESAGKVFDLLMSFPSNHMFTIEELNLHLKENYK